jgi:hypothetical protein
MSTMTHDRKLTALTTSQGLFTPSSESAQYKGSIDPAVKMKHNKNCEHCKRPVPKARDKTLS